MCGICGIVYKVSERQVDIHILRDVSRIAHREPADEGSYIHLNVGLAVKRLSIIDVAGGK